MKKKKRIPDYEIIETRREIPNPEIEKIKRQKSFMVLIYERKEEITNGNN